VRKGLPYFLIGTLACLGGFGFFFLLRRLSSIPSESSSDAIETTLLELNKWKRGTETELSTLFDRVKTLAGRADRAKHKEKTSQEGQESSPAEALDLDDQGKLNQLLAQRFHGRA